MYQKLNKCSLFSSVLSWQRYPMKAKDVLVWDKEKYRAIFSLPKISLSIMGWTTHWEQEIGTHSGLSLTCPQGFYGIYTFIGFVTLNNWHFSLYIAQIRRSLRRMLDETGHSPIVKRKKKECFFFCLEIHTQNKCL